MSRCGLGTRSWAWGVMGQGVLSGSSQETPVLPDPFFSAGMGSVLETRPKGPRVMMGGSERTPCILGVKPQAPASPMPVLGGACEPKSMRWQQSVTHRDGASLAGGGGAPGCLRKPCSVPFESYSVPPVFSSVKHICF